MDNNALVSFDGWTMVFQLINLLITALLFKKFLLKPVKKILQERQDQVNGIYASASEAETKAKANELNYTTLLDGAKVEASEMIHSATTTAQKRGDDLIRQARQEATSLKMKAATDIAMEKKKALNEVKDDISVIALEIASKVVEKEINAKDHESLVEEFIGKIGEM